MVEPDRGLSSCGWSTACNLYRAPPRIQKHQAVQPRQHFHEHKRQLQCQIREEDEGTSVHVHVKLAPHQVHELQKVPVHPLGVTVQAGFEKAKFTETSSFSLYYNSNKLQGFETRRFQAVDQLTY
jgi:hypothetical protein